MSLSPRLWIAIAACTVVGVATQLPATAQPTATDQDCEDNWKSSSAALTCGCASPNAMVPGWMVDNSCYDVKATSGMNCNVVVDCALRDTLDQPIQNDVVFDLPDLEDLKNCEGTLRIGSC